MSAQKIESCISATLTGDAQKNALAFVAYLRKHNLTFEKGKGYWETRRYWLIEYKGNHVCFILIDDPKEKENAWTIWSDDSGSHWFEDDSIDEQLKKTFWKNVDFCANCGFCSGGTRKTIFGKEFHNVCRTTLKFENPDDEALLCMEKMVEIRKASC